MLYWQKWKQIFLWQCTQYCCRWKSRYWQSDAETEDARVAAPLCKKAFHCHIKLNTNIFSYLHSQSYSFLKLRPLIFQRESEHNVRIKLFLKQHHPYVQLDTKIRAYLNFLFRLNSPCQMLQHGKNITLKIASPPSAFGKDLQSSYIF